MTLTTITDNLINNQNESKDSTFSLSNRDLWCELLLLLCISHWH